MRTWDLGVPRGGAAAPHADPCWCLHDVGLHEARARHWIPYLVHVIYGAAPTGGWRREEARGGALTAAGPGELIRQVRAAETADPAGIRWPRNKIHDDATAILIQQ